MPAFDLPAAELEHYRPDVQEPPDFDEFWRDTLKEAAQTEVLVSVRPVENGLRLTRTWDIIFRGFGGDPVRAWYSRPAEGPEPLPAVVEYAGYGRGRGLPHERLTWVNAGYAHLLMDNRGQGDQYGNGGATPDPHAAAPGGPGPAVRGLPDPRAYHYRRLITDAVRAVTAVRALPGVDGTRVAAVGNSQGGGLALAVAGLVPDLAAVLVTAPFLCGIRRALELTDASPYGEIGAYLAVHRGVEEAAYRTLSYVEGVSFARRAAAPAHFGTGLRDTVCPPSGAYAAFNRYGELSGADPRKEIHAYPYNGHEGGDAVHVRRQLDWLRDVSGISR
ncbi:cephalosporin-C deacetylase [Streptomyces sp. SAI-208]|uniref:acetylxylan esterase n=1 Tax=unclassified Streptomyces TaxID=2593676 RepID=UPI002473587D|nr:MULTISPECIES: acetylxylan esterase [unclassified Streptomyces]MDH6548094.1 cephalosporin-C deacetylase [Streptomyces sp. SAI-041]MDH6587882.1 cephalosporin-C deacetylase [Streptomyces sp. SAI-133]MDH6606710.1 cephalosporin-C deacetylase [Streptomyces sp. SAI-208]